MWLMLGKAFYPELIDNVGYGKSPSIPFLKEILATWREITAATIV